MVFGPATIDADGFEVRQSLDTMVFQWFPMVANHWSNDGMVTIHSLSNCGTCAHRTNDTSEMRPFWLSTLGGVFNILQEFGPKAIFDFFRKNMPLVIVFFLLFDLSSNVHKRRKSWQLPNFLFVFLLVSDNLTIPRSRSRAFQGRKSLSWFSPGSDDQTCGYIF